MILAVFIGVASVSADDKAFTEYRLAGKKIELARYAKMFVDEGNVKIEVAPFKSGTAEGAILLFHGVEGPWDNRAVVHTVRDNGYGSENYVTDYQGKKWVTIAVRSRWGGKAYYCAIPGVEDEIALFSSDKDAALISPQKIFQEYQRQNGNK
jgi:hypothetical protein